MGLSSLSHESEKDQPRKSLATYGRRMGSNELSYYLPSRADGAGDMISYVKFDCDPRAITTHRINLAWAILLLRHPPYASTIVMESGKYDQARFVYTPPPSSEAALIEARDYFEFVYGKTGEELAEAYLNGPRTLSDNRLCYLFVSLPSPSLQLSHDAGATSGGRMTCELAVCFTHTINDGTAAHYCTNDLLSLIGGPSAGSDPFISSDELKGLLEEEWNTRWGLKGAIYRPEGFEPIPKPAEERMPFPKGRWRAAAEKIAFQNSLQKDIGGHTFPRTKPKGKRRNNKVSTVIIPTHLSRTIIARCKAHGVTVSNTIFVLSSFAWIRLASSYIANPHTPEAQKRLWRQISDETLPIMMYTAVNLRPYMDSALPPESYVFLTLGYLNVVLPGFLPHFADHTISDEDKKKALDSIFWFRAKTVRAQSRNALSSPFFASRNRIMSQERALRAKAWAVLDDKAEEENRRAKAGLPPLPPPTVKPAAESKPPSPPPPPPVQAAPKAPSAALIGVSIWPSVDPIYEPSNFPAINLIQILTQTRKNTGGMLIMGFTLREKINITIGWDANCFPEGIVEEFWEQFENGIGEFLVGEDQKVELERGLEVGLRNRVDTRL